MAVLALLIAIAVGAGWTAALLPLRDREPRWAVWLAWASLGTGIGVGATSVLFFLLRMAGAAQRNALLAGDLVLLGAGGWLAWRAAAGPSASPGPRAAGITHGWIAPVALCCGLLLLVPSITNIWLSGPNGELDALAGWNLRAKFLAAPGEAWRNAVSLLLTRGQPAEPLLLPGAVARGWTYGGGAHTESYPSWLPLVFVLATVGVLTSAVALLRGAAMGCLAAVVLLGTHTWLTEIGTQFPDLLLGLLMLSALAALALEPESRNAAVLAGLAASLGAWTLNEGLAALLALAAATLIFAGAPRAIALAAGALPVGALVAGFHAVLSPGGAYSAAGLAHGSRYGLVGAGFLTGLVGLGGPFTHPLLMVVILIFVLRPDRTPQPFRRVAAATLAATLVAGWLFVVMAPGPLNGESLQAIDRRIAQLAPGAILLLCCWLRQPGDLAVAAPEPVRGRVKRHV